MNKDTEQFLEISELKSEVEKYRDAYNDCLVTLRSVSTFAGELKGLISQLPNPMYCNEIWGKEDYEATYKQLNELINGSKNS